MEHRAFAKIPTLLSESAGGGRWVATEKIHGAQLVVATDGELVMLGKRKAWLAADEPFFGWQLLRNELEVAILAIHAALGHAATIHIYGELFGGGYPHPDVEPLPGLTPVQTGIWYAPTLRFAAFDLLVVPAEDEPVFIAHEQLEALAEQVGLLTVPVLGRGTRRELIDLPVRYPSTVAGLLGLPALADNVAEGYVLKPDTELPARARPLVKHKIPEFDENRFDESMPFDHHAQLSIAELLRWAAVMINPVRIASARSKVGEDPTAIAEEVALDVWIDLESIYPRRMLALDPDEDAEVRTALLELASAAVG
ncbi:MAG TPA: RNA ligase family protein [Enhygromyxa sp.]|nr:RNA ligase family protein [Enhygromyxa sp.]